jgi:hypothetical protein
MIVLPDMMVVAFFPVTQKVPDFLILRAVESESAFANLFR